MQNRKPTVLVFSGHDPSGAAGLQADIESIAANGCHGVSVITALTAQNTKRFERLIPQEPDQFRQQIDMLLEDIPIDVCKIGLTGSLEVIEIIAETIERYNHIPVVLDPVLAAGTGTPLIDEKISKGMVECLFPKTTLLTPNLNEARTLTGAATAEVAAAKLFENGCENILITGADTDSPMVVNTLYRRHQPPVSYEWERQAGQYHGSGCTLSAACAALLAGGLGIREAVEKAQAFTWQTLKHGRRLGKGQLHPDRFYK